VKRTGWLGIGELWRSLSYDPGLAWHSVPLKQPGSVPEGAGVGGWFAGLFGDPRKWHCAQTGAFAKFVDVWVYVVPAEVRHGLGACGALTPWQR
jgi:hypothetical protein